MNTTQTPQRPNRILLIVVAVAVLAIVATVILSGRPPQQLDPGTPEATVQTFVQAAIDRDFLVAESQLSTTLTADCRTQLRQAWIEDSVRVTLDDVLVDGDTATVYANVQSGSGGLFDSYRGSSDNAFSLIREDGEWRITQPGWPYLYCEEVRP